MIYGMRCGIEFLIEGVVPLNRLLKEGKSKDHCKCPPHFIPGVGQSYAEFGHMPLATACIFLF